MILLILAACSSTDPASGSKDSGPVEDSGAGDSGEAPAEYLSPDQAGPYQVGTAELTIPGPEGLELRLQLWFPVDPEATGELHRYDELIEGSALEGASPLCEGPRPVLLFSHGNTGVRWQSLFLTEHLARRGWVVAAPDHLYNTLFDNDTALLGHLIFRRPLDIAASFDAVVAQSAEGGLIEGCVEEADGYAVAGHSFGGYTTFAVAGAPIDLEASAALCETGAGWLCEELQAEAALQDPAATRFDLSDPRAWAAIPMAPAGYEVLVGGYAEIAVPTLVLGGSRDTLTTMADQVEPAYAALSVPERALGTIVDAGHYTFSNACDWLPTYEDCAPPYLDPALAYPIIATLGAAWLDLARGEEDARGWLPPEEPLLLWSEP
jgi:predicted dienelactone hydrolase